MAGNRSDYQLPRATSLRCLRQESFSSEQVLLSGLLGCAFDSQLPQFLGPGGNLQGGQHYCLPECLLQTDLVFCSMARFSESEVCPVWMRVYGEDHFAIGQPLVLQWHLPFQLLL